MKISATRLFIRRFNEIRRENTGAAAIEFAIAGPVFILFMLGIIEIGIMWFGNAMMNNAVSEIGRFAQLGCLNNEYDPNTNGNNCMMNGSSGGTTNVSDVAIRTLIQRKTLGFVNPNSNRFQLRVGYSLGNTGSPGSTGYDFNRPISAANNFTPNSFFNFTIQGRRANALVTLTISYDWPRYVPFLANILGIQTRYTTTIFYRNEPYFNIINSPSPNW